MSATAMRGTSAASLRTVLDTVREADVQAGDEFFAVVAALDANPALRRVLTDPSTDGDAKVGLARQLFGDKVDAGVLSSVEAAVGARWSAGRDLTDGLELAGVAAWIAAARANGKLDRLEDEMFQAGRIIHADAQLRAVVSDRSASVAGKAALLSDVFGGKVLDSTLALLRQASAARAGSFETVLDRFSMRVAASRERLVAVATVAYELDDSERERLAAALAAKYNSDVQLNLVVDPSVVGGITVSVGDEVVDATMSTRLEAARRQLAG